VFRPKLGGIQFFLRRFFIFGSVKNGKITIATEKNGHTEKLFLITLFHGGFHAFSIFDKKGIP